MKRYWTAFLFILSFGAQAETYHLHQSGVATSHPLATEAGIQILKEGGNAFDAAVAIAGVLAVVEPYSNGLGGGGLWLLHKVDDKGRPTQVVVDAREVAPLKAHKELFYGVKRDDTLHGGLTSAIPGTPAALHHIAQHYGRLPLSKTLQPAITLAEKGVAVNVKYQKKVLQRWAHFSGHPEASRLFLNKNQMPEVGYMIKQPELASVLKKIAQLGRDGFYKGEVASLLVKGVQETGGIWTLQDLKNYEVKERAPLIGTFHDWKVITVPPPSSGGLILLTSLNILKQYEEDPLSESDRIHLVIESLRRAYCDRAKYVGDPDFTHIPVDFLLSEEHARDLKKSIDFFKATPSNDLKCGLPSADGPHTTHFSVMDEYGNRVSTTMSLNSYFGSLVVPKGTGVLINNQMDDFSLDVGYQNMHGLIGHAANLIASTKRPVTNMTPIFLESKKGIAVMGSPGGARIPSLTLLSVLSATEDQSPLAWVGNPRYHHQYLPDIVEHEKAAFSEPVANALKLRGYTLEEVDVYGDMQLVFWNNYEHKMVALSDPRVDGKALVYETPETVPSD